MFKTPTARGRLKIAVIGAGPTGLSAALHLIKYGKSHHVDVYEAAPVVGGMSRSFTLFDHIVDLGPHRFFTQNKEIFHFWRELAGDDCHKVDRITSILYGGQFIGYPLKFGDLIRALPLKTKSKIFSSYLQRNRYADVNGKNFATTMRYRFGDELYEIFFKGYTERLWGVADDSLSASLAFQRIGRFGLGQAVYHALRSCVRAVEDSFYYPKYGCGQIWERAADLLREEGCGVFTATPVTKIAQTDSKKYIVSSPRGEKTYDHVISTLPLSQFIKIYENSPQALRAQVEKLQFRSTILVYVEVSGRPQFKDQWIYLHADNIQTGRITNFSNWGVEQNQRETHILCLEYWCTAGDEFWTQHDRSLSDVALEDLKKLGYEPHKLHRSQVVRLANTYPVITNDSESLMTDIVSEFEKHPSLQTVGRGGAFKYNNQDHCIEMGIGAAKNVLGQSVSVWAVNSGTAYHESQLIDSHHLPPG